MLLFTKKGSVDMSVYKKYLELKNANNEKLYLFKVGNFYIFINEDAEKISKITTLKITNHATDVIKCGFPSNSLEKYLDIFNNLGLKVEIIDDISGKAIDKKIDKYLDKIRKLDINNTTPIDCFKMVCDLKKIL